MQNRFGFKDLVFLLMFVAFIIVVILEQVQIDRQSVVLKAIKDQSDTQTGLLSSISRSLDNMSAGGFAPTTQSAGGAGNSLKSDPFFASLNEAKAMPDYAKGDYLVDNFETKLGGILTPFTNQDLYSYWVQNKIFDPLIIMDPDTLEYVPELARSFQSSPDGLKFTFQLRHGVRFSDGVPMTADDVVFTYNFVQNPKINAPRTRSYLTKFKSAKKTADDEVTFEMSEPYYSTLNAISQLYILPQHFYSKFGTEEFNQNPGLVMGTGPYRMPDPVGWRPGQKVALVRNQLYWGEPPAFEKIIFNEVEEEAAQETMFRNGELDVYRCRAPQFDRLSKDPTVTSRATGYAIDSFLNGFYFIGWNEKRNGKDTIFTDKRVRKGLSLVTDRQRACTDIYLGHAKTISGPFGIGSPQADPTLDPLPYDVEQGKKLLAEAGFAARDNSGVLKTTDGTPLHFRFSFPSGNEFTQRIALFLKDNFAKAGVIADLDPQPWAVINKMMEHRDFEAIFLGWSGDVESDLYQLYDSTQIADAGDNFVSYSNPELDAVVRKARTTVDRDARMKLWQQGHRILADDQVYTFLFSRQELRFIDKRIHNVRKTKAELNVVDLLSTPIPWYVPKGMQRYTQ